MEDSELLELLRIVVTVVINKESNKEDLINDYLYHAISDWGIGNIEEMDLIFVFTKAYHFIICDNYLGYCW